MRLFVIAGLVLLATSTSAFACRGTAEYSEAYQQLAKADIPADRKAVLKERLDQGQKIHDQGHVKDSMELRMKSLLILDEIKNELSK